MSAMSSDPGSRILSCLSAELDAARQIEMTWRAAVQKAVRSLAGVDPASRNAEILNAQICRLMAGESLAARRAREALDAIREQQRKNREDYEERIRFGIAVRVGYPGREDLS
jgi:hypothetical protein